MVDCDCAEYTSCDGAYFATKLDVPCAFGALHGDLVALLLSSATAWPGFRCGPYRQVECAFVLIFAWLFFGESLTPWKIVGGGLITVGAIVLALA